MRGKRSGWKIERASVHKSGANKAKSNKYTKSDDDERPAAHSRTKIWVGGYIRKNGQRVEGHFRYPSPSK